jgi:hypothetical protein
MTLTFDELRRIKHELPSGSMQRIANALAVSEETVRNYFGGTHYAQGESAGFHLEPGPQGGIVVLDRTDILDMARSILHETRETA